MWKKEVENWWKMILYIKKKRGLKRLDFRLSKIINIYNIDFTLRTTKHKLIKNVFYLNSKSR